MSVPPADPQRKRPLVLHLTTADISLELLIGPQLSAFIEAGYDVHATSAPGPYVDAVRARGVTFHPLEHSTRSMSLLADLRAAVDFFRLCRELRPDIVHTHNPKPGVYGRIASRLARVPVVVNTVHGLYAQPTDPLPRRIAVYGLERLAAFFSHAELIQNPEDVDVLRRLRIAESKLRLLGNGIDLERFHPGTDDERRRLRRQLDLPENAMVVGAIGRLVAEKGYRELLTAWASVHAANPDARLVIIGMHDPSKPDAIGQAELDQARSHGVVVLGERHDVEQLYRVMDVYVLASHREGFPRSAMEAAASGVPLVVTDIRGCRQVVRDGETGRLVPVRDATALAATLAALLSDPTECQRLGTNGAALAVEAFDQRSVIETTLDVYRELVPRPGGDRPAE